jgi:hypothetical protein
MSVLIVVLMVIVVAVAIGGAATFVLLARPREELLTRIEEFGRTRRPTEEKHSPTATTRGSPPRHSSSSDGTNLRSA